MSTAKEILLSIILLILFMPLLQNRLHLFTIPELEGDFVKPAKPILQKAGWLTGDFQAKHESWLEQNLGFHNLLVRINNQLDYSLFRKAHAEGVVVGKNSVLYEYDYIRAWQGVDFIGERTWDKKMRKLKFVQQHLKETQGIDLILVLEPSKAWYEPEYIPEKYTRDKRSQTNYETIVQKADSLGIGYMDLNRYYRQLKDTSRYLLYPKYGVHWSVYGMTLMAASLVNYLERIRGIDMPDITVSRIELSDSLRDTDYDAGKPLNLLLELPHGPMAYPKLEFEENTQKTKPMVLVVGDSYYWNIFNAGIPANLFKNEAFWYFNALVYPDTYYDTTHVWDIDIKAEVEKQELVILTVTDRFYYKYDWGFIDALYRIYTPNFEPDLLSNYENQVRENIGLFNSLIKRSKRFGRTLEQEVSLEADFLFQKDEVQNYLRKYGTAYYERIIRQDTGWMNKVAAEAREKQLTIAEALHRNADYMFWKGYPDIHKEFHGILEKEKAIRSDSTLLASVLAKAGYFFLSPDEMIHQQARLMYRQDALWIWKQKNK